MITKDKLKMRKIIRKIIEKDLKIYELYQNMIYQRIL